MNVKREKSGENENALQCAHCGAKGYTFAAADRNVVELGARINVGRDDPEPVRYTIPVPVRGLRSAAAAAPGVVADRMGAIAPGGSLTAGGRANRDGIAEGGGG